MFTENGRLIRIVFKLKKIVRGIFEKKCPVLDPCAGIAHAGLLIKQEAVGCDAIGEALPLVQRRKNKPEVARINSLLTLRWMAGELRHELMAAKLYRHR